MQKRYGPAAGVCDCALCMIVYDTVSCKWATKEEEEDCLVKLGIRMLITVFIPFLQPIFLYPGTWAYEEPFKKILRKLYGDESGSTSTTR